MVPNQGMALFDKMYINCSESRKGLGLDIPSDLYSNPCFLYHKVASGCKLEVVDDQGCTPLMNACFNADEHLLEVSIFVLHMYHFIVCCWFNH